MVKPINSATLKSIQSSALKATKLMKVLANQNRLLLLCEIAQGEKCVSDLEASTGILQPTLSQQLTVLRENKIVATRRDGKQIYYTVKSQAALALMNVLYEEFCKK
jgi:ArsR family transcriptional regulator